jgi:hypothetical protein
MTYFEVTTRRWYNHDPLCVNYRRCSWLGRTCDYKEDLHGELPLKVVVTLAEILQLKYKTATTGKKNSKEELKQSYPYSTTIQNPQALISKTLSSKTLLK